MTEAKSNRGALTLWAKGFSITQRSSEFQRVLPIDSGSLSLLERQLDETNWGTFTRGLHLAGADKLSSEFVLALGSESDGAVLCASASEDQHRRPSLVFASVSFKLNWDELDTATASVASARALVRRLCRNYATELSGARPNIEQQLKSGLFVSDREFNLNADQDSDVDWASLMLAAHQWQGIRGLATPLLFGLCSNVLITTDADTARSIQADGEYSLATKTLVGKNPALTPWFRIDKTRPQAQSTAQDHQIAGIHTKLDELMLESKRTRTALEAVMDYVLKSLTGGR